MISTSPLETQRYTHTMWETISCEGIPYSRKLLREKTFANFVVLWLYVKVFSMKFGGVASFVTAKIIFFTNSRKFFSSKVSRYVVKE